MMPSDFSKMTEYDETGLSLLSASHTMHRFPVDGTYSFRIVLNGHRPNQSMPAQVAFWIDGKQAQHFDVDATDLEGQVVELRTHVSAGEHLLSCSYLKQYHGLPADYHGPEPSTRPPVALRHRVRWQQARPGARAGRNRC